jgi:hypothetical protein
MRNVHDGTLNVFAITLLVAGVVAASACGASASTDSWAEAPPFEDSRSMFSEYTLGLAAGVAAPMLPELGILGDRTILVVQVGCGREEIAALRLVAEAVDFRVVVAITGCSSGALREVRVLVGDRVGLVTDPLASLVQASYWVGDFVGLGGVTFLIDEDGQIVLRRLGSPVWLFHKDLTTSRAFAEGEDVSEVALPQFVLSEGEQVPIPQFELLDHEEKELGLSDGTPRLFYSGPGLETDKGALILEDLSALRLEFPDVEFVWRWAYKSDDQLAELWSLFNTAGIAYRHPEWYELPFDEYMDAVIRARDADFVTKASDIEPKIADGWRHVFDPGNQLGISWCLRFTPHILILDGSGMVALPFTTYPTDRSHGEVRVHPGAREALRQVLLGIEGG